MSRKPIALELEEQCKDEIDIFYRCMSEYKIGQMFGACEVLRKDMEGCMTAGFRSITTKNLEEGRRKAQELRQNPQTVDILRPELASDTRFTNPSESSAYKRFSK
eukprot:TRINITY_DN7247_c0_g2_i1.p1 TRINITY_DN7247_c0_g2~~TRINITY_DN7247_c0_g2_i1.p1  ORF type:complete len:105 (+),score=16.00 TRINITY_DN7247_c0_g2_i1:23-337(+)